MPWFQTRRGSWLLRAGGVASLTLAVFAARSLRARAHAGPIDGDVLAWFLAVASFVLGSGGCAFALVGRHLFDRIAIARRWSRYDG